MGKGRISRLILLVLPGTLLLCSSCRNGPGSGVICPRVVDTQHQPAIVLKSTVFLLSEPRLLEDDYVYPAGVSRQRLVWNDRGEEWVIRLAGAQYAFGGIVFRRAYDFSENHSRFALMFSVQPAEMIPYLSVGLADGECRGARVLTDVPLASRTTGGLGSWAHVTVRLDDFGDEGTVIGGARDAGQSERQPMDWADIREIRITGLTDQRPDQEITIRNLRFGPVSPSAIRTPKSALRRSGQAIPTPGSVPAPHPASALGRRDFEKASTKESMPAAHPTTAP